MTSRPALAPRPPRAVVAMSDCASGSPARTAPTAQAASPQAISDVTPNDDPGSLSR